MIQRGGWGDAAPLLRPLIYMSGLAVVLFLGQVWRSGSWADWYLNWNLLLAWLPLLFAVGLDRFLKHHPWSDWRAIGLTALWLGFLPNSFYLVTDFIHLQDKHHNDLLFGAVVFTAYTLAGLALGYLSLGLVHRALRQYHRTWPTVAIILAVLLLCSFAIYLGRDLRWNTWDLIVNPAGILFDVSDRLIDPRAHPTSVTTTATFFILLSGLYGALLSAVKAVRRLPK